TPMARTNAWRGITLAFCFGLMGVTADQAAAKGLEIRWNPLGHRYVMSAETGWKFVHEGSVWEDLGDLKDSLTKSKSKSKRRVNYAANANYTHFPKANIGLNLPRNGWVQHDPSAQGPNACVLLSYDKPELMMSLVGEPVGVEAGVTVQSQLAASQELTKRLPGSVILPGVRKLSAPGIPGLTYAATAPLEDGRELQYSVWVAVKNGYRYSLVVYGDRNHNRAIDATMKQFVGRLRQIQPNHVVHAAPNVPVRR
ncbi:MAG: hypothetical protein AAF266_03640, partial [Planctomycetota bacterium]